MCQGKESRIDESSRPGAPKKARNAVHPSIRAYLYEAKRALKIAKNEMSLGAYEYLTY